MEIKKILVPVDFSSSSENALRHAILFSDKLNGEITLLHVVNSEMDDADNVDDAKEKKVTENAIIGKQKLFSVTSRILSELVSSLSNVPTIHTEVERGKPSFVIDSYSKDKNFDFILMGTKDEHTVIDKIFGSVASNVVKSAPCSVFVIPDKAPYSEKIEMCYATDLSEVDPYEIWSTSKLLAPFNPNIQCVHFNENNQDKVTPIKMEELEEFFSENASDLKISFHEFSSDNKEESMLDFIAISETNLLVTFQPNRGVWEDILHKSFTKQMILEANIPLLVLRKK